MSNVDPSPGLLLNQMRPPGGVEHHPISSSTQATNHPVSTLARIANELAEAKANHIAGDCRPPAITEQVAICGCAYAGIGSRAEVYRPDMIDSIMLPR